MIGLDAYGGDDKMTCGWTLGMTGFVAGLAGF